MITKLKMLLYTLFLGIFLSNFQIIYINSHETDESDLKNVKDNNTIAVEQFVEQMNNEYSKMMKSISEAAWNYELTREKHFLHKKDTIMEEYEKIMEKGSQQVVSHQMTNAELHDVHLRKQFEKITRLIDATLPTNFRKQVDDVYSNINKQYSTLEVNGKKQDINDLRSQMYKIKDIYTLENLWCEMQMEVTEKIEPQFMIHFSWLKNISDLQGLNSPLQVLARKQGVSLSKLKMEALKVMNKLHPLLTQMYYYFRKQLPETNTYYKKHPEWTTIHINFLDKLHPKNPNLKPYSWVKDVIQNTIQEKSIGIEWANQYFYLLGFQPLNASKIIKLDTPTSDRKEMVVFNLLDGDYRLIWTPINPEEDLKNIFHGMAIIHNLMQFKNHPPILQDWPYEIFQEAIAGAASMSAFSPSYLRKSGIVDQPNDITLELYINRQMESIIKLFSPGALPLGVITDITIQEVYEGKLTVANLKRKWWKNIKKFLSIRKPEITTSTNYNYEFGPGIVENMIHASRNIKALLSEIFKYQFFQELCIQADQFNPINSTELPLFKCDITKGNNNNNNNKAIEKLKAVMQLGDSLSWDATFQLMTGKEKFDVQPILNYYNPLIEWLNQNVPYQPVKELSKKFFHAIKTGWLEIYEPDYTTYQPSLQKKNTGYNNYNQCKLNNDDSLF